VEGEDGLGHTKALNTRADEKGCEYSPGSVDYGAVGDGLPLQYSWHPTISKAFLRAGSQSPVNPRKRSPLSLAAPAGQRSDSGVHEGGQLRLRKGADLGAAELAIAKQHQCGNAAHAVLGGHLAVGIHIHLAHFQPVDVVVGDFVQDGRDHLAGSAPAGPEVDQYRKLGLQHIRFETRIAYMDDFLAH